MTPLGTRGVLNDTPSIYFGDATLASETLWWNLAASGHPPAWCQRSSPYANMVNHHSGKVAKLFTANMSEKGQALETLLAANCLMGQLTAGSKSQMKSSRYEISLIFRQTSKTVRNVS
jgi:hypothetical protein